MLATRNVHFSFGKTQILNNVCLSFHDGITAILGANGSGKTTLFSLIATQRRLIHGEITFGDLNWSSKSDIIEIRRILGWVPQTLQCDPSMTVAEFVSYCGWLRGLSAALARDRAATVIESVNLSDRRDTKIKNLSGGMQRRVMIASAIVHNPKILVLDEPTAGLDVVQREQVMDSIAAYASSGVHVLISTHLPQDAELSQQVIALSGGQVITEGSAADLLKQHGSFAKLFSEASAHDN